MDQSAKAQLLLERSLRDRQQQLQQKTQEWQGKEQALFTKVTPCRCLRLGMLWVCFERRLHHSRSCAGIAGVNIGRSAGFYS
jgi:hypothetical protein